MARIKTTFIEINVYKRMYPLVSNYLIESSKKNGLDELYEFTTLTFDIYIEFSKIIQEIEESNPKIICISCYVWNIELVRRICESFASVTPRVKFILGGPEVMNQQKNYRWLHYENAVVVNGEGEKPLIDLLKKNLRPENTAGISYFNGLRVVDNSSIERIKELDEIPTPFTNLNSEHSIAVIETNRGCPFRCTFCFWGAATNDKVNSFGLDRVKNDLKNISKNGIVFLYIADANWGQSKRDVELTEYLAKLKKKYGFPSVIYFSAAKNSPKRVTHINKILKESDMISSQPVSMQSLNPKTLEAIDRKNIRIESFIELQKTLKKFGMCSFVELIWPLPKETLNTYKDGIASLISGGADTIIVYSHILLKNTPMYLSRDEYELKTLNSSANGGMAEIVVNTNTVGPNDFDSGLRFFYLVHAIYNTKCIEKTLNYLLKNYSVSPIELFDGYYEFAKKNFGFLVDWIENSIKKKEFTNVNNYGEIIHLLMHEKRKEFFDSISGYILAQYGGIEHIESLVSLDQLCWGVMYLNTPIVHNIPPKFGESCNYSEGMITKFRVSEKAILSLSSTGELPVSTKEGVESRVISINYSNKQFPLLESVDLEQAYGYCHGMIEKMDSVRPFITWD